MTPATALWLQRQHYWLEFCAALELETLRVAKDPNYSGTPGQLVARVISQTAAKIAAEKPEAHNAVA